MKILVSKLTKSKRFEIINHKGYTGDFKIWNDALNEEFSLKIKELTDSGYKEVPNANGGDDDYLCVDHQNEEYIWCENGFYPFDIKSLNGFDHDNPIITLEYLYSIRN